MDKELIAAMALMLALPVATFLGGAWVMNEMSGRIPTSDPKPLNQRFGYTAAAVQQYWEASDPGAEKRFLELDLAFPFLYCGTLASSLLIGWSFLGRQFNPGWIFVPVVITMLADWVENLVQLQQFKLFMAETALQPGWIRIASTATIVKLVFFYGLWLILALLLILLPCLRRTA